MGYQITIWNILYNLEEQKMLFKTVKGFRLPGVYYQSKSRVVNYELVIS